MKAILDEMLAALSRGERVVLCSILASSGSVPRGAGAKIAVFEDDRVLGTIGGASSARRTRSKTVAETSSSPTTCTRVKWPARA